MAEGSTWRSQMVTVIIYIEGGVLPNDNLSVQTMSNSQTLRKSFSKLFESCFPKHKIHLQVINGSSNNQTIEFFKTNRKIKNECLILLDLDSPPSFRKQQLKIFDLDKFSEEVFFMIQKMEAWILSQPDKIEQCYAHLKRRRPNDVIQNDPILKNKYPADIEHPDKKLNTILSRYFRYEKKGQWKNKKYGKLKDAADLLALLDIKKLRTAFEDVDTLILKIESFINS